MAPTPRGKPNIDSSSLFDNDRFSDMVIKFSDREIKAHRFVLCECQYFDKLCGPDSPFTEAQKTEVTLLGDDPDAIEAVLRHLYNFTLEPPTNEGSDRLRYYCNVVVASDKYGILGLAEEATLHLACHLINTEAPQDVVASLKIITEEYSDYESLQVCVSSQLKSRLKELASVPDLAALVVSQPQLFAAIVADAIKLADLQPFTRYSCHFCRNVILRIGTVQPVCCKNKAGSIGTAYVVKGT